MTESDLMVIPMFRDADDGSDGGGHWVCCRFEVHMNFGDKLSWRSINTIQHDSLE